MADSKEQATVTFTLTEQEVATLLAALQASIPAMLRAGAEPSPLAKRLEKANAKGWK